MRLLAPLSAAILAVAALVGLWWLETLRDAGPASAADDTDDGALVSYFEAFELRDYGVTRASAHVLRGDRLAHFGAGETAEVQQPRLLYAPADAPAWRARAALGELGPDAERLDLRGSVVLKRRGTNRTPMSLETHTLTIFQATGRARTSDRVRIRGPGWYTTAVGMQAYLEQGRVELASEVRGRYRTEVANGG